MAYRCDFCGEYDSEDLCVAPLTDDPDIVACDEHVGEALDRLERQIAYRERMRSRGEDKLV